MLSAFHIEVKVIRWLVVEDRDCQAEAWCPLIGPRVWGQRPDLSYMFYFDLFALYKDITDCFQGDQLVLVEKHVAC